MIVSPPYEYCSAICYDNRDALMLKDLSNSYSERGGGAAISGRYKPAWTRRLSAAAVIPALLAYIKVVAIKKLVVGFLPRTTGCELPVRLTAWTTMYIYICVYIYIYIHIHISYYVILY